MKSRIMHKFRNALANLKLNRKIQLLLLLIIVPLFILFMFSFFIIYDYNQQYDRIIANASEAGRFSINFKKDFDYKIYLLIAGHSTFQEENPYASIESGRDIVSDLIKNASLKDNRRRAESIMKLLGNLEKYVKRIENNKIISGHYDDNINIWENDVQLVTALIQSNVLEYTYYETKSMEQVRSKLSASLNNITMFSFVGFVALASAALFLSFAIPNSIVKPIHHLIDVTNEVAKGDLTVCAKVTSGIEVRKLSDSLNSMIEKIDSLLAAVKTDETNLREAELELLQSQINPHFLYNTLDTIIWLAESGKQDQVVKMVKSLSNFFRTSLNHGDGMVTLREEERHVHSYLQIQQVRYQDILEYDIDFPDSLMEAIIPKITLQPLVENALYHGIKNRRGKGKITLNAANAGDDIIISVADNGIGMNRERLNQVIALLDKPAGSTNIYPKHDSYGLYNVNERIKLKFGGHYGISIESEYGKGTCVKVKIPFKKSRS
jgi:two-component system sensor histidine kinase YesM